MSGIEEVVHATQVSKDARHCVHSQSCYPSLMNVSSGSTLKQNWASQLVLSHDRLKMHTSQYTFDATVFEKAPPSMPCASSDSRMLELQQYKHKTHTA